MRMLIVLNVFVISLVVVAARAGEEKEEQVSLSDCPKAVQKTLKREARDGKIAEVEKEQKNGDMIYEAEVWLDDKEYEVKIRADGTLLGKVLEGQEQEKEEDGEEKEEKEEQVRKTDLPKSVKKTLARESRGGKVEEIEREQEGDTVVYEAELEIAGKEYELEIAEDGTLLSKVLEEEEDEDEKEEEDDDEDEEEDDDEDEEEDDDDN